MRFFHKAVIAATMTTALGFGFLHLLIPNFHLDFDRLHIFLFNLCSGGFILLYFGQNAERVTVTQYVYFALSIAYAVSAFLEQYLLPLVISIPLVILVESVRIRRFSFFPSDFFRTAPTSDKFLQAALLCLSIGTGIASLVILNNEYLHIIHLDKLTLDVFFLGYSFPLSLMTMSVMFTFAEPEGSRTYRILKEVGFWSITGGVIVFFVFIIFEMTIAELIIANILLAAVCMVYVLFARSSPQVQQRSILMSGMAFLVLTGVTGVGYLLDYFFPSVENIQEYFLRWHSTVALYGWNLSGLFIVVRWRDFPVSRRTWLIVGLHWATVLVFAPLGKYLLPAAAVALLLYGFLVGYVFFARPGEEAS